MEAEFQPDIALRMFGDGKEEKLRPEVAFPTGTTSALVLSVRAGGHTFIGPRLLWRREERGPPMAKRRAATRVALTDTQRERLERLWFVYGNYGSKSTPGNHQFIQGLLEHGLDLRPMRTKRTPKRDLPSKECEAAVDAALASPEESEESSTHRGLLRLAPSPGGGLKRGAQDPELKRMLDEMRRGLSAGRDGGVIDPDGKDAA